MTAIVQINSRGNGSIKLIVGTALNVQGNIRVRHIFCDDVDGAIESILAKYPGCRTLYNFDSFNDFNRQSEVHRVMSRLGIIYFDAIYQQ